LLKRKHIHFSKKENIMKRKMAFLSTLLGALVVFTNGSAEDVANQSKPMTQGVAQRNWRSSSDMKKTTTPRMTTLDTARGCPLEEGFFFTADFLYWKASEDTLNWTRNVTATSPSSFFGPIYQVNPDWKPAFRVGLGWNTAYDNWDLYLNWTWYNNSTRESLTAETNNAGLGLIGFWLPTSPTRNGSANYYWRLRHNMFDVELGRKFFISRALIMRPFGGVRGGWINRKFDVTYADPDSTITAAVAPGTYYGHAKYYGVGPRFGSNNEWFLGAGIRIHTDFAFSLLYGEVYSHKARVLQQEGQEANTETVNLFDSQDITKVVPNAQMFLGFGWAECFCSQDIYLALKAGWEVNQYWNLPAFINPGANNNDITVTDLRSSFTLQGLTVKLDLEF
jgi:hypothetical protein